MTNPADLFTRCGQALCGAGPKWKEQLAEMLGIKTNTVDNMSKGTSRIPQGIWIEISGKLIERQEELATLRRPLEEAAHEAWKEQRSMPRSAGLVDDE